ncbi:hypothetical protein AVEN_60090-1, partial [Araneus ventricosus]
IGRIYRRAADYGFRSCHGHMQTMTTPKAVDIERLESWQLIDICTLGTMERGW